MIAMNLYFYFLSCVSPVLDDEDAVDGDADLWTRQTLRVTKLDLRVAGVS